jgi:ZIP family zinc transporter
MLEAFTASLIAGLATGLGAAILLVFKRVSMRVFDTMIGFSAGVMASASIFGLIIPAIELGGLWRVVIGFLVGAIVVHMFDMRLPELFRKAGQPPPSRLVHQGYLMAGTIALHNVPEGFAVGAGYASGHPGLGLFLALAIALQNIPEGTAVAAPLIAGGIRRRRSVLLATLSGLIEPVAAVAGFALVNHATTLLPSALGFAAGAMFFAVSHDLLPESHNHGHETLATWSFLIGFLSMLVLDQLMG